MEKQPKEQPKEPIEEPPKPPKIKQKIKLEKSTEDWLRAHTEIDINSATTLKVVSHVFATLRDELKEPNMNLNKIIEQCERCPCATHNVLKKAAEMLKNHLVGEA